MPLLNRQYYTIADIYALPEGKRAELIEGEIFDMAPPSRKHQEIVAFFTKTIGNYIDKNKGNCKVYPAPYYLKLSLYQMNGVREYWIVDTERKIVIVYDFENLSPAALYRFDSTIKTHVFRDLEISFSSIVLD